MKFKVGHFCSILFYINWNQKLKTKIFFVGVNENSMTFLYSELGGQENIFLEEEKKFSCPLYSKCIKKSKCQ